MSYASVPDWRLLREALQSFLLLPFQKVVHPSPGNRDCPAVSSTMNTLGVSGSVMQLGPFYCASQMSSSSSTDENIIIGAGGASCGFVTIVVNDRTSRHNFASRSFLSLF